jgi:hypothetical protein
LHCLGYLWYSAHKGDLRPDWVRYLQ